MNQSTNKKPDVKAGVDVQGHIKIFDPNTKEVFVDKRNAIHYENFSNSLAQAMANKSLGHIYQMAFGNGGSSVDTTGIITYLPTKQEPMLGCTTKHFKKLLMTLQRPTQTLPETN